MTFRSVAKVGCIATLSLITGCSLFESPVISACEEKLKAALVSPASYHRVSADVQVKEIENRQGAWYHLMMRDQQDKIDQYVEGETKPRLFTVTLSYDASNSFGALLRGRQSCEFFDLQGIASNARTYNVTLLK